MHWQTKSKNKHMLHTWSLSSSSLTKAMSWLPKSPFSLPSRELFAPESSEELTQPDLKNQKFRLLYFIMLLATKLSLEIYFCSSQAPQLLNLFSLTEKSTDWLCQTMALDFTIKWLEKKPRTMTDENDKFKESTLRLILKSQKFLKAWIYLIVSSGIFSASFE